MAAPKRTTTERKLGWRHQQQRKRLIAKHVDGTTCWWCGRPMYRDRTRNWDRRPLEADHSKARSQGGHLADRLLCSTCNRQRQDGRYDHLRPAATGKPFPRTKEQQPSPIDDRTQWCRLDW